MSDPWQAVDPWGGTNTVPNNSYYPPAAASAPSQRWTDANGNEYILDIQGETVTASCEKLNYHESGTLKNGKLGLFGTWHDYTPEKITFGPPLSTSWTRVDQGEEPQPAQAEPAADNWSSWGNANDSWNSWNNPQGQAQTEQSNGAWGSWGGTAAPSWEDQEKKRWEGYQREFQSAQEWNKERGILPGGQEEMDPFSGEAESKGSGEDFCLYDSVAVTVNGTKTDQIRRLANFEDLFTRFAGDIPVQLEENMNKCGFSMPTPVQKWAIPAALAGRDIMCCAQTGSGKTAAFLVPTLASMIKHHKAVGSMEVAFEGPCKPDTLILSPTRELCLQIFEDALKFCHKTKHRCLRVYGQEKAKTQILEIARGADLCVATVGRLYDFVGAGIISVADVNCFVLDEADRMLDLGWKEQIEDIVENHGMPPKTERQTWMFSATFPQEIQTLALKYLHDHLFISVGVVGSPAVTVTQIVQKVEKAEKTDKLVEFISGFMQQRKGNERMLVFTNSKNQAKLLDQELWKHEVATTAAIHGDLDQPAREANLAKFRDGKVDVMVATDVASRGLDISGVSHVLNYDAPKEISLYVQRIGRTGRIGHRGTSITFITFEAGWCIDSDDLLTELPDIMKGAPNTEIPDWLDALSKEKKEGTWYSKKKDDQWNYTDVRKNGNFEGWKDGNDQDQAQANSWSNWQGTGATQEESTQSQGEWNAKSGDSWSW
ncbi:unnamed protein product [Effrenium voratum]|uniref:RNA helicase n=1 Tax=Effrenium voratum TaxID=2562239 RepID=A0AA36MJ89_9DINO|nr:unnamed protein product [Effrenium voratum]CAJ1419613.1 unnamed protein product [Effrenium voratum]